MPRGTISCKIKIRVRPCLSNYPGNIFTKIPNFNAALKLGDYIKKDVELGVPKSTVQPLSCINSYRIRLLYLSGRNLSSIDLTIRAQGHPLKVFVKGKF